MLRIRNSILTHLFSSSITFPPQRLISAAAPAVCANPSFVVEDYLVGTCGLTRAQALKASPKLSHLNSPTKPDAVLAFLAGLGLSNAAVAAAVAKDPKFLCASVERTLAPIVAGLTGLGLSHTEISGLVSLDPRSLRHRPLVSNLSYYISLLGSYEKLLRIIKRNSYLLSSDIKNAVKPNITFLLECGVHNSDVAKLCISQPRLLTTNLEQVRAMVACAEGIGVPRGSGMFRIALDAVAFLSEEKIATKVACLKNTFRWSDYEVRIALCKGPMMLTMSKDTLQSKSELLISEMGLEPSYLARRPAMVTYSLQGRLRPRYYVVKFLMKNGLLKRDPSYYTVFSMTENVFVEKLICPHKEFAPHLAEDYVTACRGEVPISFRFS